MKETKRETKEAAAATTAAEQQYSSSTAAAAQQQQHSSSSTAAAAQQQREEANFRSKTRHANSLVLPQLHNGDARLKAAQPNPKP